nr:immunoglobulin light chain junction region [Macaca mulatta]MOV36908.1 immunoglobulin light chain junction region [Macaca mulatta]MOV36935.1 immunoglobulin light chain junction region [Macaca mulatta]MOV36965.1 immunoglobulin light chain junction region [Macaca mulatta]MOV36970.1 immunoglobulin light chain junction region [Macaca mulatta]
CLQYNSKPFTF